MGDLQQPPPYNPYQGGHNGYPKMDGTAAYNNNLQPTQPVAYAPPPANIPYYQQTPQGYGYPTGQIIQTSGPYQGQPGTV